MASDEKDVAADRIQTVISGSGVLDSATKFDFARYFAPKIILTENERYGFMNAHSYAYDMCDAVIPDENKSKDDNKDNTDNTDSTDKEKHKDKYLNYKDSDGKQFIPLKDGKTRIMPSSKDALIYAYVTDEEEDELTYLRGMRRIVYAIGYPFNGFQTFYLQGVPYVFPSFSFELAPTGRHVGDWEHVTIFVTIKDKTKKGSNKPDDYELYCILASQHGAYNIGLAKNYYDEYNNSKDKSFGEKFRQSAVYTYMKKRIEIDLPMPDKKLKSEDDYIKYITSIATKLQNEDFLFYQNVSQIITADNEQQAKIYSSFNGHANHFSPDIFPLFTVSAKDPYLGTTVASFNAGDITDFNKISEQCNFLYDVDTTDSSNIGNDKYPPFSLICKEKVGNDGKVTYTSYTLDNDGKTIKKSDCDWANDYSEYRWGKATMENSLGSNRLPPGMDTKDAPAGAKLISQLWNYLFFDKSSGKNQLSSQGKQEAKQETKQEEKETQLESVTYETLLNLIKTNDNKLYQELVKTGNEKAYCFVLVEGLKLFFSENTLIKKSSNEDNIENEVVDQLKKIMDALLQEKGPWCPTSSKKNFWVTHPNKDGDNVVGDFVPIAAPIISTTKE